MLYVVGDGAHTVTLYDFDERFVLPYLKRVEMLSCPYTLYTIPTLSVDIF
ncbi:MAG: hypothetical protein IKW04_03550 [Clostridia bacterium]|nr:hypothetical protein [Clostridia bacterium]